ncbi:MAG TPA: hypothetical protein VKV16_10290 [Solirubrobacteraceae bacterium]|nr:hypothetical protein [Solirubrobacteraceae bacterium]
MRTLARRPPAASLAPASPAPSALARALLAPASHAAALLALALLSFALAGCGKTSPQPLAGEGPARKLAPVAAQGAVSLATRNTTRLGGADVASDAAAVARAVYPGLTAGSRPAAAVLVDEHDWTAALAASVLAAAPTGAPILFSQGDALPAVSRLTLEAMRPLGEPLLGGAQVIRIATSAPLPAGYVASQLPAAAPAETAAAIERLAVRLDGAHPPRQAIVLAEDASPRLAMPAAGLAAESGAPILLAGYAAVPAATVAALDALHRPAIYVIDADALGHRALDELRRLGSVHALPAGAGASPAEAAVQNAIEVARFTEGDFGWGVKEPGHGLVFADVSRPLDAPAAALLSATGEYGPLLLLARANGVPPALAHYLSDIQPAYASPQFPPVRGAYNHGWLIGDEQAIAAVTQAEIDSMLEIAPRTQASEEAPNAPAE